MDTYAGRYWKLKPTVVAKSASVSAPQRAIAAPVPMVMPMSFPIMLLDDSQMLLLLTRHN